MKSIQGKLPLVRPEDLSAPSRPESALHWIDTRRDEVNTLLRASGGVLLRGFGFREPEEFRLFVRSVAGLTPGSAPLSYIGGHSPRSRVTEDVYTSTSMPQFFRIPLHSEMSYLKDFPTQISFFCREAALSGGETPLADTRTILARLPQAVREKFERLGVRYARRLAPYRATRARLAQRWPMLGLQSWPQVLGVQTREEAELACRSRFSSHSWLPDHSVIVRSELPAVRSHPVTGDRVWFNQAYFSQLHPRISGRWLTPALKAYYRLSRTPFTNSTFGDGSPISDSELESVLDAIDESEFAFPWEQGDVLLLDNLLMAHGRNPFRGPREVLVGLVGPSLSANS